MVKTLCVIPASLFPLLPCKQVVSTKDLYGFYNNRVFPSPPSPSGTGDTPSGKTLYTKIIVADLHKISLIMLNKKMTMKVARSKPSLRVLLI